MLNTTNAAEAELIEYLIREEIEDNKVRKKRAADLRAKVREIILTTRKMPRSLAGIDTMLWRAIHRPCERGEPSVFAYDDEFYAPPWSPCPLSERERIGCEIAEAALLSGLNLDEAYWVAYNALGDVARMFPGH